MADDMELQGRLWREGYEEETGLDWLEYVAGVRKDAWIDEAGIRHVSRLLGMEVRVWTPGGGDPVRYGEGEGEVLNMAWQNGGGRGFLNSWAVFTPGEEVQEEQGEVEAPLIEW